MGTFEIQGGFPLKGEIIPQGAKNESLQVICATLLTSEEVTLHNVPDILDVQNLIELIRTLGVSVVRNSKNSYTFCATDIDQDVFHTKKFTGLARSIRGSVMILGPLLARIGKGIIPGPGGDKIGRRRLDTHFNGLVKLGASYHFDVNENLYQVKCSGLSGNYILLEEASVTGTANIVMAAVKARGKTVIYNAACEPYVQQLCRMLNRLGARISGIGSNLLTIEGVDSLGGCEHTLLPDMIEVGSFIGIAAMTHSAMTIKNASVENLGLIPHYFRKLGITLEIKGEDIFIPCQKHYQVESFINGSILTISDGIWPGLTPDLLSVFLVVATQAHGSVLIHQKMFESRLFFVDKLIDMGAQIILCDPHRATVIGLNNQVPLRGTSMSSPDIRAGVALLIAALSASGTSVIHNIEQIDRGYEQFELRLQAMGARIKRIETR